MNLEQDIKNLNYNGYTLLKKFLSKNDCNLYINLIEKYATKKYSDKIKTSLNIDWDGKWLYNLQNKDYKFYDLLHNEYIEEILKYKLNDKFTKIRTRSRKK